MKVKRLRFEEHLGTVGLLLAVAVFFAVTRWWHEVVPYLAMLGIEPVEGPAGLKQQKVVGAVCALVAMTPLLGIQLAASRYRAPQSPA